MTAKELLRERIEALNEEQAAEALELLALELFDDEEATCREFPPAPRHIIELARKAVAEAAGDRVMSDDEFGRQLGLD